MEYTFASTIPSTSGAPNRVSELAIEPSATFTTQRIAIKHPGYGGNNTLLALPACDGGSKSHAHYATVHATCTILADSPSDGWLSPSRNGEPRTEPDNEGLVPGGVYFFHVTTEAGVKSEPYPVVPNFRAWQFPHGRVPVLWRQAAHEATALVSPAAPHTTETCRITNKYPLARHHISCRRRRRVGSRTTKWINTVSSADERAKMWQTAPRTSFGCGPTFTIFGIVSPSALCPNVHLTVVARVSGTHTQCPRTRKCMKISITSQPSR